MKNYDKIIKDFSKKLSTTNVTNEHFHHKGND